MDKSGVVEVVDRPRSQQVLSTRWVPKQRLDGSNKMRTVARAFEQTVSPDAEFLQERQRSRLCEDFSRLLQVTVIQFAVGDGHSAFSSVTNAV